MTGWQGVADAVGLPPLDQTDLVALGIALSLAAAGWLLGILAARVTGAPLARLWERLAGVRADGIADRMCALVRYAVAAVFVAIVMAVGAWPPAADILLGLALGIAASLLAYQLVRGVHLPRWGAWLIAAVVLVAAVAQAAGGLAPFVDALERIGFDVGRRRFSLLGLVQISVTILLLFAVVRLLARVINHSIRRSQGLDATQQLLAQKLAGIALLVVAFFVGIDLVGIDLTALAIFSGAFGLAVGFGFQKTFGNLIAGIILLMDRSIKPGDVIVVGDSFGHVNKIGVRAVSIITRDGKEHLIPNENLMTQEVENWSHSSRDVRIHIPVGVAFDCDLKLAQRLMIEATIASKRVLKSPEPNVWLMRFGDYRVEFEILAWIKDPEAGVGNVQSEILNRLWDSFKAHGIRVPYAQQDLHIRSLPDAMAQKPSSDSSVPRT
ncbi:mechanosensitive ion channel family protein [Allosphingosinicella indica]|uniref:Mechanosensitive ion channel n=1 Tax=Allosphingosinicella indica TaxID=941907 RepID=A0A1X7FZE7_9SPHN|nr:mechanosensitive ion channel domain-containing protein [Allosphingosinicella indica]SMF61449.1 Mechanosensitive ion channel [Allosphingosinicella indica]